MGRNYLGIEISQKYYDIAVKRTDLIVKEPELFPIDSVVKKPDTSTLKQIKQETLFDEKNKETKEVNKVQENNTTPTKDKQGAQRDIQDQKDGFIETEIYEHSGQPVVKDNEENNREIAEAIKGLTS